MPARSVITCQQMVEKRTHPMALAIRLLWDGPFGAVSVPERPSWLTAEPRTTASGMTSVPGRLRTAVATPSARPYPSPLTSNVLQRPTGDSDCGMHWSQSQLSIG